MWYLVVQLSIWNRCCIGKRSQVCLRSFLPTRRVVASLSLLLRSSTMSDYDEYYEEELRDRYQSDADEIYYSDNSDADAFYPYRSHVFKCYDRVERSTLPLPPLPVEALQLVFGFALDDARPRYRARMCTSYSRVCRLWRKSMNKQCAKIMVARSHYCEKLVERLDERKYGVKGLRVPIKEVELLVEHHSYGGRGARYTKLLKNPMLRGLKSLKITLGSKMAMESLAAPVVTAMSKLHELERFELVPEFGRARQGDWHTGDESCTWKAPGFWDITEERLETYVGCSFTSSVRWLTGVVPTACLTAGPTFASSSCLGYRYLQQAIPNSRGNSRRYKQAR